MEKKHEWAVTATAGHLAYTKTHVWPWFNLAPVRHSFRQEAERVALLRGFALRVAALRGEHPQWCHLRVTFSEDKPEDWEAATRSDLVAPLPHSDMLIARGVTRLRSLKSETKETYFGVQLDRPAASRLLAFTAPGRWIEQGQLDDAVQRVGRIVAGPGMRGRPVSNDELEWLLHRSHALGCPAPDGGDMDELADRAKWDSEPLGGRRTVVVRAQVGADIIERHVAVAVVSRSAEVSEADPWMARLDTLGRPYDLSVILSVLPEKEVLSRLAAAGRKVRGQLAHVDEHRADVDPHITLGRAHVRNMEVEAEIAQGFSDLSARVDFWARIAVYGDTEKEALEAREQVIDLYQPRMRIARPLAQHHIAREMVPCEPLANRAYRRQWPVLAFAAGMPAVTARIGHRKGMLCGWTAGGGGRHPFRWDLHHSPERRERSAVTLLAGEPGCGKSTIMGHVAYWAVTTGVRTILLDPSGPLGALCYLPEFAGHAQHIDLMDAQPGSFSTYAVIPDPEPGAYMSHPVGRKLYDRAVRLAQQNRRALTVDVFTMLLPLSVAEQPGVDGALNAAVRHLSADRHTSPLDVLRVLASGAACVGDRDRKRISKEIAERLHDMVDHPAAALIFPTGDPDIDYQHGEPPLLTVITMGGLVIPDESSPRAQWTTDERMALPLLNLAAWRVTQAMYQGDRNERKVIGMDETHALVLVPSGRYLMNRSARDSRKTDSRVLYSSQNFDDHKMAGLRNSEDGLANVVDNRICGRTLGAAAQLAAVQAFGMPEGVGYEQDFGHLSDYDEDAPGKSGRREFVVSDGLGGLELIEWDRDQLPEHVRAALNTTATGRRTVQPAAVA